MAGVLSYHRQLNRDRFKEVCRHHSGPKMACPLRRRWIRWQCGTFEYIPVKLLERASQTLLNLAYVWDPSMEATSLVSAIQNFRRFLTIGKSSPPYRRSTLSPWIRPHRVFFGCLHGLDCSTSAESSSRRNRVSAICFSRFQARWHEPA